MAKKSTKKTASKPAKKSANKPAKKAPKKAASKPAASGRSSLAPTKVSTGPGPGPHEIGQSLVEMFNRGEFKAIEDKWWSPKVVSIEGMGMAWHGRKAVEAKGADWSSKNDILGASAQGPYVGASGFAVKFKMDIQEKATGKRVSFDEVGVYEVRNGKIVREEFMYGQM